jgi:RNA-binding protein NOB1
MAAITIKAVHSLVLDAGPIIKNEPSVSTLLGEAEILYTIPAVIDEIRDATTRARVETTLLPFLKLRNPRPASMKIISDFARKTGDLEVLSKPDIQILALAYELECERNHGDWRLRSAPGQKRVNGPPPASLSGAVQNSEVPCNPVTNDMPTKPIPESRGAWGTVVPKTPVELPHSDDKGLKPVSPKIQTDQKSEDPIEGIMADLSIESSSNLIAVEEVPASESDISDDEGWITPSNIKKHQAKDLNGAAEPQEQPKTMQVATLTSDFAMQNVLLRMNLNLLSPTLQTIRQLKTWVLRCHACFDITKDMSKQFCGRCGKPTLIRTSCSTDKDGKFKVHLKKNMQWNTRGDIYSIPKPVAGTSNGKLATGGGKGGWGQGLILAEDQKEYVQAMTNARRKKEKDLMDEDYLPSILSGDRRGPGGRPKVGAGRTVNSRKRN